ncbi:carbon-nitrogen hydrolase family protein [Panacibacter ginsenosidivorans]|uniref:Carbon-nitrogen hydrolase family protein n=1 Tax=Panacibacter ginsenosidivorans TaxID=1813871 RepID=A0A5B8VDY6_9BACT|nr:carbon-nitrogen hydrolase family protein [Panacibacter ginsenosidivorans]QEC68508.1 carbon-nitrogen hydrolase family protein [Panacibacter ginsenosidivorans]
MKIALASPALTKTITEGLTQLEILVKEAAEQEAVIVCFPESFIPGYPTTENKVEKATADDLQNALQKACAVAAKNSITIILPMDWYEADKFLNVAFVISAKGGVLGYQSKNQLDPTEDGIWDAGTKRQLFEVNGIKFGITICHEGFRYPESVRWAARHGAAIVFHPHFTGSNISGPQLTEWGNMNNPYYEKAMMIRAMENTIYFASVNYATTFQESATSLIAPDGKCIAHQEYGKSGIIVVDIDPSFATGLLAKRFKPDLYA